MRTKGRNGCFEPRATDATILIKVWFGGTWRKNFGAINLDLFCCVCGLFDSRSASGQSSRVEAGRIVLCCSGRLRDFRCCQLRANPNSSESGARSKTCLSRHILHREPWPFRVGNEHRHDVFRRNNMVTNTIWSDAIPNSDQNPILGFACRIDWQHRFSRSSCLHSAKATEIHRLPGVHGNLCSD